MPAVCRRHSNCILALVAALAALSGCGGQSSAAPSAGAQPDPASRPPSSGASSTGNRASATGDRARTAGDRAVSTTVRPTPSGPIVRPAGLPGPAWQAVATVGGQTATWEAQRAGVTLLRFDQRLVELALHAGLGEPSGSWRYGDQISPSEIHRVIAAFNGGFKFETGEVGYMAQGRIAVPLQAGFGSIVTYDNGTTQIGAWGNGVPAHGVPIASVLQNLHLLIDHGVAASNIESCTLACWGATVGGITDTARSALGITGEGQLVWAAGEGLTPADIATALIGAGVQRAVELDINPDWVAGYMYVHGGSGPRAAPVVPGQLGISGRLLAPYTRDFLTVLAR